MLHTDRLARITDTHSDLTRELANADESDHSAIRRRYADMTSAWECDTVEEIDALNALVRAVA